MSQVINLRSDTFTSPDDGMRAAMAKAVVGDDVFGEDASINALEAKLAKATGKERALFVPSGTMGNLICALIHGEGLFSEIIMGSDAHTANWEAGGASVLGRVFVRQVTNNADGTLPIEKLEASIQYPNIHNGITRAIFLENTQNACGGAVLPMEYIEKVRALCDKNKIILHCDGARAWNAAVALGISIADVLKPFDTASLCLSKGLGAPVGSIVVGSADFIAKAKHVRKMLGGGMRQAGIIAEGANYAFDNLYSRMGEDHANARLLAKLLVEKAKFSVVTPQSNIVVFTVADSDKKRDEFVDACLKENVKVCAWKQTGSVRAVVYYGITAADIEEAVVRITTIAGQLGL